MADESGHHQLMDIAQIIANNLSALMATTPDRDTLMKVSKAAGLGFGTVRRAKNGDANITVQNLELLAHAFRRTARDLLVDSTTAYTTRSPQPPAVLRQVAYSQPEESELLHGYRDASPEVREIMLDLARKASKKNDCTRHAEKND